MFSKERPLCPSFYSILCLNKVHETLSLNWSKYKAFGNTRHPPHPNSRTISINVNKSYVEGWGKTIPIMFYCIVILWTGLLDDKSALLQNRNSLGKTLPEISLPCAMWMLSKRKIWKTKHKRRVFDLQWLWYCGWHPNKMSTASFVMSSKGSFDKMKKEKLPEVIIVVYKYPLSSWQLDNSESYHAPHEISLRHPDALDSVFGRSPVMVTWLSPMAGHTRMALFVFALRGGCSRIHASVLSSLPFPYGRYFTVNVFFSLYSFVFHAQPYHYAPDRAAS